MPTTLALADQPTLDPATVAPHLRGLAEAAAEPIVPGRPTTTIAMTEEVLAQLAAGAVVACGTSGGKDSAALVLAMAAFLDRIGHPRAKRVAIHSHLGVVEWPGSLESARLACDRAGMDLVAIDRDMMGAWEARWQRNVARYAALSCVTLITPWSSAMMRFCTGQEKSDPIARALVARYPGAFILNAVGIRAEESRSRAQKPVAKPNADLRRVKAGTEGMDWNPIKGWSLDDVRALHAMTGVPLHAAYSEAYGSSRLSCNFCVLATRNDHLAALKHEGNHAAFHRIVALEIASTFSFMPTRWVGDYAPALLSDAEREGLARAKAAAEARRAAEARIPASLRYVDGWPTRMPTPEEAALLADVRREVSARTGLAVACVDAASVLARYEALLAAKDAKQATAPRTRQLAVIDGMGCDALHEAQRAGGAEDVDADDADVQGELFAA